MCFHYKGLLSAQGVNIKRNLKAENGKGSKASTLLGDAPLAQIQGVLGSQRWGQPSTWFA